MALLVGQAFRDGLAYGDLGGVDRDAARVRREDEAHDRVNELVWRDFRKDFGPALDALERYEALAES